MSIEPGARIHVDTGEDQEGGGTITVVTDMLAVIVWDDGGTTVVTRAMLEALDVRPSAPDTDGA